MKTLKAYLVLTTAAGALSVASAAHATTIDFSTYAIGTAISSIPGASVSLLAGPGPGGSPTIGNFGNSSFPVGLGNSTTNGNPTGTMIDFAFTRPVSGISFTFDNYGDNGPVYPSRYWTSADGTYVSWGDISGLSSGMNQVDVAGSGITNLVVFNGSNGRFSWYFEIGQISYTAAPGPAPGVGLAGLAGLALAGLYTRTRCA